MAQTEPIVNPYTLRGAVRDPGQFFGRRREIEEILGLLKKMVSVSVVGERLIGKSSLLRYLVYVAGPQRLGKDGHEFFYLDLEKVFSTGDFYDRACAEIKGEPYDPDNRTHYDHRAFEKALRGRKIVLCLDEFEQVTDDPNFDEQFFNVLRSLAQEGNLALVVATKHWLRDLYRADAGMTSPFYNIFHYLPLGPLTEQEARELINKPAEQAKRRFTEDEVNFILDLAGRHPYRLNLAGGLLYEAKSSGNVNRDGIKHDFLREVENTLPPERAGIDEQPPRAMAFAAGPAVAPPKLNVLLRYLVIILAIIGSLIGWFGVSYSVEWGVWTATICFLFLILLLLADVTGLYRWSSGNS